MSDQQSCPIPKNINLHAQWRNHDIVTDDMVAWFKKHVGCKSYQGIIDVDNEKFQFLYNQSIPKGYVCWQKVDMRYSVFPPLHRDNIAPMLVLTSPNGREIRKWEKTNNQYNLVC